MIDTGATLSTISIEVVKGNGWYNKLTSCQQRIIVADNRSI